ncbi:HvfA family oxazolone/thioamide-modified RiPP metallophore [Lysobacter sp. CA199]|uniref:HvfA family oxazolone/thioamide-modified RiPP metallophore n=1 Tax=Lysobacter sp. CA199 TaxID=3455608 RepID=UPI003F8D8268
MSMQIKKPLALALGATLIGGLSLSASAFAMSDLSQGYLLGAQTAPPAAEKAADAKAAADTAKHAEGTCGADKKAKEGSCGADKKKHAEGKCGEGKCGADKKKAGEGKCGEGKCGADKKAGAKATDAKAKKAGEGKCGEGKCGGSV